MRTDTETLAKAMDVLARDIQSGDGAANAAIQEAADRLRELEGVVLKLRGGQWKTADGATVHRDMPVYVVIDEDYIEVDGLECRAASFDSYPVEMCYSTKALAEAAHQSHHERDASNG